MRSLVTSGFVMIAGVASLPTAVSPWQAQSQTTPDYRKDFRFAHIKRFFQRHRCPTEKLANAFVDAADRYHLDWRLLPSLSFVESTCGKLARNNNLFGWDSGRTDFPSLTAGIHQVGYRLANSRFYKNKELNELLVTYNPNAGYADRVKSVMERIGRSD